MLITKLKEAFKPVESYERMVATSDGGEIKVSYEPVALKTIDEREKRLQNIPAEIPVTNEEVSLKQVMNGEKTIDQFIASLSDEDLACIVRGEGMGSSLVTAGTASAFGGVSKSLIGKGIPSLCCDDGPSGMRLDSGMKAFSLPSGAMVASTFNPDIVCEMYAFTGLEMINNNVDVLLGPGMNIHRHPLNGRNFEYFSEDPLVTGVMGSAMMKGLKSRGVSGCAKHFCANNQETGRHTVDSVVSERALREIYLKGFEICVREAQPWTIMTAYNIINGTRASENRELLTDILRGEWGYTGLVMSDWFTYGEQFREINAGNDVKMGRGMPEHTLQKLESGELSREALDASARRVLEMILRIN